MRGDYANSVRLLAPLADQGNPSAQNLVGGAYLEGLGVERDCQKGLKLVSTAANGGYARAQYVMGRFTSTGTCTAKDDVIAFSWFKKSADQYDPDAEFMVGYFYWVGRAVPANSIEAYRWFTLCVRDWEKTPSASPRNMQATKNNLDSLNAILSETDLKRARTLIAQSK